MKSLLRGAVPLVVLCLAAAGSALAQNSDQLTNLSVDDLMKVEVTSVARRGQSLSETPAATFVISQEDIERSGATSIPELLRMVPGFDVAQIDRNLWAVSARGFNSRWSNKLLVLIDGRTVYTELWGGVRWDVQDLVLNDIERIEVTRGPGGTLWGANAVNGIVNVITKHPIDTQGMLATASYGENAGPAGSFRYGGRFGESGYFRASLKGFDVPPTVRTAGIYGGNDQWQSLHGSFRAEWATAHGSVNVQGDAYRGISGETIGLPDQEATVIVPYSDPNHTSGYNLLARWTAAPSPRSETTLTVYTDEADRDQWLANQWQRTIDLDFAHHLRLGQHNATWGIEARRTTWQWTAPSQDIFLPSGNANLFSAFAQDEWRVSSRLRITAGVKVLRQYGDTRLQPSLRALWTVRPNAVIWAAATRSVRQPSEVERHVEAGAGGISTPDGGSVPAIVFGDPNLRPEHAMTMELGYRALLNPVVSLDVTAYRSSLQDLTGTEPLPIRLRDGKPIVPIVYANVFSGTTTGLEALVTIRPHSRWDLTAAYSWFHLGLEDHLDGIANDDLRSVETPHHQLALRSFFTISPRLELDASSYYVSAIASQGVARYFRTDARLAWQVRPGIELSIAGRNLGNEHQIEIRSPADLPAVTPSSRTIVGTIQWRR